MIWTLAGFKYGSVRFRTRVRAQDILLSHTDRPHKHHRGWRWAHYRRVPSKLQPSGHGGGRDRCHSRGCAPDQRLPVRGLQGIRCGGGDRRDGVPPGCAGGHPQHPIRGGAQLFAGGGDGRPSEGVPCCGDGVRRESRPDNHPLPQSGPVVRRDRFLLRRDGTEEEAPEPGVDVR